MMALNCKASLLGSRRSFAQNFRSSSPKTSSFPTRSNVLVRASSAEDDKRKELVGQITKSLKDTGMSSDAAKEVLKNWQNEVGHEVTPEDLRKILVGQSSRALLLVFINTLLDAGAAYAAFAGGNFLGLASEQYGVPAIVLQAIAYLLAGYYVTGAAFDFFKLGAVLVARINFDVNSGAFLEAIEGIAGASSGLDVADKAREAVNSVKVLGALNKMSDLLKQSPATASMSSGESTSSQMLADLGAYLTLQRAEKYYDFQAKIYGISEEEAAEIAVIFGKFDTNDDGVLSEDEFRQLCAKYAPELATPEEVKAALRLIDTNKDGTIQFAEFVRFWQKQIKGEPAPAAA